MPGKVTKRLTFGRGINAAVRLRQVAPAECARGENFDLDLDFSGFRGRRGFDLAATAPNGQEIRGFAQLVKRDGTISTLVQAGTVVYSWDGSTTFSVVGAVAAGAKLRGQKSHIWNLDTEVVIITDLALLEPVKTWDGTSLTNLGTNLTGAFYAKYCLVENERAFFANIKIGSDEYPHLMMASALQDYTDLSVSVRSLLTTSTDSPFYLPVLDLKPINAFEAALGTIVIGTQRGRVYRLDGSNAFDYQINEYYPGSAPVGDEAMVSVGNDVVLGKAATIESLFGSDISTDVEADDLSRWIKPLITEVTSWSLVYNNALRRAYCLPSGGGSLWVLHKSILDSGDRLSPWSKYTTNHSFSMQPSVMMSILSPEDGLELVYMGAASGQIFHLEGHEAVDGGTTDIVAYRTTGIVEPMDGENVLAFDKKGYVDYKRAAASTATLTIIAHGLQAFTQIGRAHV